MGTVPEQRLDAVLTGRHLRRGKAGKGVLAREPSSAAVLTGKVSPLVRTMLAVPANTAPMDAVETTTQKRKETRTKDVTALSCCSAVVLIPPSEPLVQMALDVGVKPRRVDVVLMARRRLEDPTTKDVLALPWSTDAVRTDSPPLKVRTTKDVPVTRSLSAVVPTQPSLQLVLSSPAAPVLRLRMDVVVTGRLWRMDRRLKGVLMVHHSTPCSTLKHAPFPKNEASAGTTPSSGTSTCNTVDAPVSGTVDVKGTPTGSTRRKSVNGSVLHQRELKPVPCLGLKGLVKELIQVSSSPSLRGPANPSTMVDVLGTRTVSTPGNSVKNSAHRENLPQTPVTSLPSWVLVVEAIEGGTFRNKMVDVDSSTTEDAKGTRTTSWMKDLAWHLVLN